MANSVFISPSVNAVSGAFTETTNAIATTSTDGIVVQNTTDATVGVPRQYSPRIRWTGNAWDTDDVVSRSVSFWAETVPVEGTTVAGLWRILASIDGGGATTPLTLSDAGVLTIAGGLFGTAITMTGSIHAGASNIIGWTGLSRLVSSVNGKLQCYNNGLTAGVGLDWTSDAILKVRTTAQSAYATVDALGYSVSGVAGASKGAGGVTSITVVNGIVTAIS